MAETKASERRVLSFGDSQTEVLDYVFFGDKTYKGLWQDKWSCRGLSKVQNFQQVMKPLEDIENVSDIIVFLCFGSVDIDFSLGYKKDIKKETVNYDAFIHEMVDALYFIIQKLINLNKSLRDSQVDLHIVILFPYVPRKLPIDYMQSKGLTDRVYENAPLDVRIECYDRFSKSIQKRLSKHLRGYKYVHILDLQDEIKLHGEDFFAREDIDHHPDFIKTQKLLAKCLNAISFSKRDKTTFNLNCEPTLTEHYEREDRIHESIR